jgi:hypothetical protein
MLIHERERVVQLNWIAILSYTGSLAASLAIWAGLFRVVERLMK